MQLLLEMMSDLKKLLIIDTPKADLSAIVRAIDARTDMMLKTLDYNEDALRCPDGLQNVLDTQRTAAETVQNAGNNMCALVPYAVNAAYKWVSDKVKSELLLFATDFSFRNRLSFIISTSSFGMKGFSSTPASDSIRILNKIEQMKKDGWVICGEEFHWSLVDCDKNRELMNQFCKDVLGANVISYRTHRGNIRSVDCWLKLESSKVIAPEDTPVEEDTGLLTADEIMVTKKSISDFRFALSSYQMMKESGDGNLILANCESLMYEIENTLGIHGLIWTRKNAKYASVRAKNQQTHAALQQMELDALKTLSHTHQVQHGDKTKDMSNLEIAWNSISERVASIGEKLGLYLDDINVGTYNSVNICFMNNSCDYERPENLDVYNDERNRRYVIYPTDANLNVIEQALKEAFPHIRLKDYAVRCDDVRYISKLSFETTVPSDFL